MGENDKLQVLKNLSKVSMEIEKDFIPNNNFEEWIESERNNSWKYGGKTIYGDAVENGASITKNIKKEKKSKTNKIDINQLSLF